MGGKLDRYSKLEGWIVNTVRESNRAGNGLESKGIIIYYIYTTCMGPESMTFLIQHEEMPAVCQYSNKPYRSTLPLLILFAYGSWYFSLKCCSPHDVVHLQC